MRPTLRVLVPVLAAALALCAPSVAGATLYCVNAQSTACPGGFDAGNNLQTALTDAGTLGADSSSNTINIGGGTFTAPAGGFVYPPSNHVLIITGTGSGNNATTLQGVASAPAVLDLSTAPAGSTLSGVAIKAVGTTSSGATLANTATNNVAVTLPASSTATGLTLNASPLTDSTVTAATPLGTSVGISATGAGSLLRDTITAQKGVDVTGGTLTATNLKISTTGFDLVAESTANVTITDSLLTMPSNAVAGNVAVLSENTATLTGRSLTIVGAGTGPTGVKVNGIGGAATATITDSIFSGFSKDEDRTTDGGGGSSAVLTLDHDIANTASDPGGAVPGTPTFTNNINASPNFVDAARGDYRPRYNSPAIDSGDTCAAPPCTTTPDIAGHARPIDGNGDGSAILDRGALEYLRQPPTVTAVAGESNRFLGTGSTFSAMGTDPDADPLTYSWVFDDGSTATGQVVGHLFTTVGPHTATVTATDPTGLKATSTATTLIVGQTPLPPPPPPPDTTPPTISKLALSHASFAASSSATAISAKAKKKKKPPPPRGTKILFTLSEPSTVTIAFTLELPGVQVSGKCVAKSSKHRKGKACTRFIDRGTITRANLAAGAQAIAFSGRVGTKVLSKNKYRLTAVAIDTAGNRSANDKHLEFKIV